MTDVPVKPRVGSSCIGRLFLIPTSLQSSIVSSRLCSFLQTFALRHLSKNFRFPVSFHHCHQHSVWVGGSFDFIVSSLLLFSFAGCMPHDPSCVDGFLSSEKHFDQLDLFPVWFSSFMAFACKIWVLQGWLGRSNDGICYLHERAGVMTGWGGWVGGIMKYF